MEKLGPCPLCGGTPRDNQARTGTVFCAVTDCGMAGVYEADDWSRLSAIAANERRMREALERCRKYFLGSKPVNATMAKVCDEALKGGEG